MAALPDPAFWHERRVLVTGHTGFKGAWLTLWLAEMGASVHGFSAPPPSVPSLYELARVASVLDGEADGDVRDEAGMASALEAAHPEVVFHLAAQPIVRRSLVHPAETFAVNVTGTANVLQGLPASVRAVVVVTSDKCYRDVESGRAMREDDALGGKDPYSASKAGEELVAAAFRDTILAQRGVALGTARAGNVIGGGDWAADRLVPDVMRATIAGEPVVLRSPDAIRPWQHVLNPLSGYLVLAERLAAGECAGAWNFGPATEDERPVRWVVERLGVRDVRIEPDADKESSVLRLDSTKAREQLGWEPRWDPATGLEATAEWYASYRKGEAGGVTRAQLAAFRGRASTAAA
jgi:CDP-glucose 4,6-dehydratase